MRKLTKTEYKKAIELGYKVKVTKNNYYLMEERYANIL